MGRQAWSTWTDGCLVRILARAHKSPIYTSATNPLFSPAISMRLVAGAFAHVSRRFYSPSTSTSQAVSAVSFAASRRSRLGGQGDGGGMLSLEHFLLRSKSIKLYRDFLRASRNIPNPSARRETVDWLRDEHFEGPNGLKAESDIVRCCVQRKRRASRQD